MCNTLDVTKTRQHDFYIRPDPPRLFRFRQIFSNPLWRLHFRFHIVSINPCSIAGYNFFQKVFILARAIKNSWQMAQRLSLQSYVRNRGTNFEITRCISNFVVKVSWHDPTDMLHSSISRTVKWELEHTISQTYGNMSVVTWRWVAVPNVTHHMLTADRP
jgi:hypothetical protein